MKSSMLHERRAMGPIQTLSGTNLGTIGRTPYGVFDGLPSVGPGILNPAICSIGKSYAYYSSVNNFAFNQSDYSGVSGFYYSSYQNVVRTPASAGTCWIQSPDFSTPVGSLVYVRYIYDPVYSSGATITCLVNWGKRRTTPFLAAGQNYTQDSLFVYDDVLGLANKGVGLLPQGSTYIFTHKITVGALVAGSVYNYTAVVTAQPAAGGALLINSTQTGTADLGSDFNWEFYYANADDDNLRLTDLYMIGTGFPKACIGT